MRYLVDTNVLTRLAEPGHVMHPVAFSALQRLIAAGHQIHIVPQNVYEFWVVCTRPRDANGLGKGLEEAVADLKNIEALFQWIDDTPAVFDALRSLVTSTPVLGKNAHDARLVAAMIAHELTHLLTFNIQDFRRFPIITAVSPADLSSD